MKSARFDISQLQQNREASGDAWLEFLNVPSLSAGVYHVPSGGGDSARHVPHHEDEVYYTVFGRGHLRAGDQEFEIQPGTVVFVKAGVDHHFHDVTEDLTLFVFFAAGRNE